MATLAAGCLLSAVFLFLAGYPRGALLAVSVAMALLGVDVWSESPPNMGDSDEWREPETVIGA